MTEEKFQKTRGTTPNQDQRLPYPEFEESEQLFSWQNLMNNCALDATMDDAGLLIIHLVEIVRYGQTVSRMFDTRFGITDGYPHKLLDIMLKNEHWFTDCQLHIQRDEQDIVVDAFYGVLTTQDAKWETLGTLADVCTLLLNPYLFSKTVPYDYQPHFQQLLYGFADETCVRTCKAGIEAIQSKKCHFCEPDQHHHANLEANVREELSHFKFSGRGKEGQRAWQAYRLLCKYMHKNAISYNLLRSVLNTIESQDSTIARALSSHGIKLKKT